MSDNADIKWYVVHTYSGYENKVKVNLEKTVENNGLQDLITEVKIPTEDVTEIKNNKRRVVQRKLLPGYVMVKMNMTNETWYIVRNTRGVTGFVGAGNKPTPLSETDFASIFDTQADHQHRHSGRRYGSYSGGAFRKLHRTRDRHGSRHADAVCGGAHAQARNGRGFCV